MKPAHRVSFCGGGGDKMNHWPHNNKAAWGIGDETRMEGASSVIMLIHNHSHTSAAAALSSSLLSGVCRGGRCSSALSGMSRHGGTEHTRLVGLASPLDWTLI